MSTTVTTDAPAAHFVTFGCQMNEADSEKLAGILVSEGYRLVGSPETADVIVVNTCSIRAKAEQKAFSFVGRLRSLQRRRPDLTVVMAGCLAQKWGEEVLSRAPGVGVVLGTGRAARLPDLLRRARETAAPAVDVSGEWPGDHPAEPVRGSRVKAWVNIMHGCDNFCAYCVVPSVRGRERSRPPGEILDEVAHLGRQGYREVTLLGQNVNSYGRGLDPLSDFPGLLRLLDGEGGVPRIRFTTSHPKDFGEALIAAVRDLPSVCRWVHLPLQAGGDEVLRLMNRGYNLDGYRRIYHALREAVPEVAVTTDIIVGFPGETAREYERTLAALKELRFDGIFSFRFSRREGTAAWEMAETVSEEEKTRRLIEVQALQKSITTELNRALIGSACEVLVEGPSRRDPSRLTGRTETNRVVNFDGPPELAGHFATVRIREAGFVALDGVLEPAGEGGGGERA